jgi:seryl-tRNA synthetase
MQCPDTVEFELGQRVAGHRGYFLKGVGVLLNQVLIFNRKRNLFRIEKEVKES